MVRSFDLCDEIGSDKQCVANLWISGRGGGWGGTDAMSSCNWLQIVWVGFFCCVSKMVALRGFVFRKLHPLLVLAQLLFKSSSNQADGSCFSVPLHTLRSIFMNSKVGKNWRESIIWNASVPADITFVGKFAWNKARGMLLLCACVEQRVAVHCECRKKCHRIADRCSTWSRHLGYVVSAPLFIR